MNTGKVIYVTVAILLTLGLFPAHAAEKSRYMGGEVTLTKAPNGALVNAEILKVSSKIAYSEPIDDQRRDQRPEQREQQ